MKLICEQALKIIDDKEIKQWLSSIIRYDSVLAFTKKFTDFLVDLWINFTRSLK